MRDAVAPSRRPARPSGPVVHRARTGSRAGSEAESSTVHQLMLHHGFGDFLMALPAIRALRASEGATLDIVVKNQAIADFGRRTIGNGSTEWHLKPGGALGWLALARRLRQRRPISFLGIHAKSRLVGAVALATGAPSRVGPVARYGYNLAALVDRDAFGVESVYDERRHKVQLYLDFVRATGIAVDDEDVDVTLDPPDGVRAAVGRRFPFLEEPTVGIAPFCGLGQHKRWTDESFAAVVRELGQKHRELHFALLGHESDREDADAILRQTRDEIRSDRVHDLVGGTDLVELLAVVERFSLLVAVCNGPSHVAAAAEVPVVGLYGPTNPGFTGPYSDRLYVVQKGFRCSPCYRTEFNQGCGNPRCMLDLRVGEVVAACEEALAGLRSDPVPALENSMATTFTP